MRADTPLQMLERGAAEFGAVLSSAQLGQFDRYLAELQKWNRRINLTGTQELQDIITRHVLDSLAGLLVLNELQSGAHIADLGSGAGFPGLPIKIARPDFHMTLIEPRQKRAAFLTTACAILRLQDVDVVEATIDPRQPVSGLTGRFQCVLARAVSDPHTVKDLAAPLLQAGGQIVMWASERQATGVGPEFSTRRYRVPYANLTHALLMWRSIE